MRKRHVTVSNDEIEFCFRAKNRTLVRRTVRNRALAREMRHLVAFPNGSRLFRFERDGETADLTAPLLNEYIADNLGEGFTAKDFRTWGGTLLAAIELAGHGPPASEAEAKRVLATVMRKVAQELGNTPAVARASYVSPVVVEHYREGRTLADFSSRRKSDPPRLTGDERALVRMLRARPS